MPAIPAAMRSSTMTMYVIMMFDGIAARIARMRADDRDQARKYCADQRQKDNCLDHLAR